MLKQIQLTADFLQSSNTVYTMAIRKHKYCIASDKLANAIILGLNLLNALLSLHNEIDESVIADTKNIQELSNSLQCTLQIYSSNLEQYVPTTTIAYPFPIGICIIHNNTDNSLKYIYLVPQPLIMEIYKADPSIKQTLHPISEEAVSKILYYTQSTSAVKKFVIPNDNDSVLNDASVGIELQCFLKNISSVETCHSMLLNRMGIYLKMHSCKMCNKTKLCINYSTCFQCCSACKDCINKINSIAEKLKCPVCKAYNAQFDVYEISSLINGKQVLKLAAIAQTGKAIESNKLPLSNRQRIVRER